MQKNPALYIVIWSGKYDINQTITMAKINLAKYIVSKCEIRLFTLCVFDSISRHFNFPQIPLPIS